jgi:hypothetical protein
VSDKEKKEKRGSFADDFGKMFERAGKKAGTAHRHDLGKGPKFDIDVIKSGHGGFSEPKDDGIEP